jgi:hypothetical protein
MKILSIEIETEYGRRVVKLAAPIDIDSHGDMPPTFRALTEVLWGLVREIDAQQPESTTPRAEA